MAKDTKERILTAAPEMSSQKGFEGTNIRELSASLGLVKSGIYRHFESKEAIWNALSERMIVYYGERFGSSEHLPPVPDSSDEFVAMTMRMVRLTILDEQDCENQEGALVGAVPGRSRAGPGDEAFFD